MPDEPARLERRFTVFPVLLAGVWLVFLAPAVQQGWAERGALVGWVGMGASLLFGVAFVWSFGWARRRRRGGDPLWLRVRPAAVVVLLVLLAVGAVMSLSLHGAGLVAAVYVAVAGIMLLPPRWALVLAVILAAGTEALARLVPGWEGASGLWLSVALAAFAMWGVVQAIAYGTDLARAREENAALMVDQERARMARDLHDILGHSLTVISVKAELANRMVAVDPERARTETADIQRLSRDALLDVRATVEGFREVSLPVEISRARSALGAAGIRADLPGSTDHVPSPVRELFAWTIREGVTNVVRHSGARGCTVVLAPGRVTVTDDGTGPTEHPPGPGAADAVGAAGGYGLAGLRDRAVAAGAQVFVETPPSGGFTLSVVVRAPTPVASPASAVPTGGLPGARSR